LFQTLSLWAVADYGEVRDTGAQKLRRPPQGDIASLKGDEASHKNQLKLPNTQGTGARLFIIKESKIDANLSRNEKKLFTMVCELLTSV
jgi:hypothetical protein